MKTLTLDLTIDFLKDFALTSEEMINVRGGEGEPILRPNEPPVKI